jgi:hypothetical protein
MMMSLDGENILPQYSSEIGNALIDEWEHTPTGRMVNGNY